MHTSQYIHHMDVLATGDIVQTKAPAGIVVQLYQARTSCFGSTMVFSQDHIWYQCRKLEKIPVTDILQDMDENFQGSDIDCSFAYLLKMGSKYICLMEHIKMEMENSEIY